MAQERSAMERKQDEKKQVKVYKKKCHIIVERLFDFFTAISLHSLRVLPYWIHFHFTFKIILLFSFSQALRSQWNKDAQSTQSNVQTSLTETQNSLTVTQAELARTHKALSESQEALSQTQWQLQESRARLEELQTSSKEESQKLEEELKQAWADRDAAACELLSTDLPSSLTVLTSNKSAQSFIFNTCQLNQSFLHENINIHIIDNHVDLLQTVMILKAPKCI